MSPEERAARDALKARLDALMPGRRPLPDTMSLERLRSLMERYEAAAEAVRRRGRLGATWAADEAMFAELAARNRRG
jgi:hypothetical protein